MPRLNGGQGPGYFNLMAVNIPASKIRATNYRPGIWSVATSGDYSHTAIVVPTFSLSLYSIVATVYGTAGTGTVSVQVMRSLSGAETSVVTTSFSATALTMQNTGPYVTTLYPIAASTDAAPLALFFQLTSTTWTQTSGGICLSLNAWKSI